MAITDRESAKAWLETQEDQRVPVAFATRAALRAAPGLGFAEAKTLGQISLPALRAILTSGIAGSWPTPEVSDEIMVAANSAQTTYPETSLASSANLASSAANSAANSARSAAHSAEAADTAFSVAFSSASVTFSANSAAFSARFAFNSSRSAANAARSANSAAFFATQLDGETLERIQAEQASIADTFKRPLWPDDLSDDLPAGEPNGLAEGYTRLVGLFDSDQETWGFWKRWLEGMRNGAPLPWDLQTQVALIGAEDGFKIWEKGPEVIAQEIIKIEQDFKTRIDRPAVFDPATGVFGLAADPAPPFQAVDFACKRVMLALDNALASGAGNGLKEDSYETVAIRSAVERHPDDASVIAVSFFDACMSFDQRIGDAYPDDPSLINLKNALWTTVEEITELDSAAKARVERYVQLGAATPLLKAEQEAVPRIVEEVTPYTNAELEARIREAGDLLKNSDNPPRSVRARFSNWVTTIVIWMDKTKKGEARVSWLVKQIERMRKWFPGDGGPPDI